ITNVLAGHLDRGPGLLSAVVEGSGRIADHRAVGHPGRPARRIHVGRYRPARLTGSQIYRARHGGSESGAEVVVAKAEMLGVVPQRRYRVAVAVAHDEVGPASAAARTQQLDKLIEQAAVVSRLFGSVVVIVVADADKRLGPGTIDPERRAQIRVP